MQMSPLFACSDCGVQIERSVRLYRELKGRVLCSTCKDRQEAERNPSSELGAAQAISTAPPRDQPDGPSLRVPR